MPNMFRKILDRNLTPKFNMILIRGIIISLLYFFAACFPLAHIVYAEIVDGPANLREKPGGKIIAILNDGVEVDIMPPYILSEKWLPIGFVAYVEKAGLINSSDKTVVKENFVLYDKQGKIIGKTINPFKFGWDIGEELGRVGIIIDQAYVFQSNIKPNSIPECELKRIIDAKESSINKIELAQFLKKYEFKGGRIWEENDTDANVNEGKEIEDCFIFESRFYMPESPQTRMRLIFYNKHLVAIIYRSVISSKKNSSSILFNLGQIMYIGKLDAKIKKKIQKEIIEPLQNVDQSEW
jgi:hypothetical protein